MPRTSSSDRINETRPSSTGLAHPIRRLVGWLALAMLAACTFGSLTLVGSTYNYPRVGGLAINEEADRVYVVGELLSASIPYVAIIDPYTGNLVGQTPAWTGIWETRAVASDWDNDHFWTLHANGSIVEWPKDASPSYLSFRSMLGVTPGRTRVEVCDFERMPGGDFVFTALEQDENGTRYGVIQHSRETTPGQWLHTLETFAVDVPYAYHSQCPRVSYDSLEEEVVVLKQWVAASGHFLARYQLPTSGGGLSLLGEAFIGGDVKYDHYTDMTAMAGKAVLSSWGLNAGYQRLVRIFDVDTGTGEDSKEIADGPQAVAIPKVAETTGWQDLTDVYGAHSWYTTESLDLATVRLLQ